MSTRKFLRSNSIWWAVVGIAALAIVLVIARRLYG